MGSTILLLGEHIHLKFFSQIGQILVLFIVTEAPKHLEEQNLLDISALVLKILLQCKQILFSIFL